MKFITRLFAVIIVFSATYYFVYWVPCSLLLSPFAKQQWMIVIVADIVSLFCAIVAGCYVWKKLGSANSGLISSILIGSAILGGVGFLAGFFGPIIFTRGSPQGPFLGIFFTGPLGFLFGGIAGGIYWAIRLRNA